MLLNKKYKYENIIFFLVCIRLYKEHRAFIFEHPSDSETGEDSIVVLYKEARHVKIFPVIKGILIDSHQILSKYGFFEIYFLLTNL
jgi:hypothetical protein